MSHSRMQPKNLNKLDQETPISEEVIKDWLAQQRQKLELEHKGAQIEELRIQSNERLAMKSMEFQARDIKARPGEMRKHLLLLATIIFFFALLFTGLIIYLLHTGKDEFAYNLLKAISYIVVSVLSFFAGRKTKKTVNNNESEYVEAEEIQQ